MKKPKPPKGAKGDPQRKASELTSFCSPETDPEGLSGETLTLQVRLADGSDAVYQLRRGLYFHRDDRPWKKIDPERAAELESLLQNLPGDELPTAAVFPSPGRIIPDFSS